MAVISVFFPAVDRSTEKLITRTQLLTIVNSDKSRITLGQHRVSSGGAKVEYIRLRFSPLASPRARSKLRPRFLRIEGRAISNEIQCPNEKF